MQFVPSGPDVPDRLLKSHEEGNVVFFCGAGISYDAGLPGFKGLTEKLYDAVGEPADTSEQTLINEEKYDLAINLLERRTLGGRSLVRKHLANILTPKTEVYDDPEDLSVHKSLLALSKDRTDRYKLITTNFDRIFEEIISRESLEIETEVAPHLPLPKKSRWNSIVYLHGLLPEDQNDDDLNRLVISSGDFGLAYLIERWASRFVTELFRNFTVCFVGYSINDPVMRYMMDALAADRLLGESSPEMFAFMSYEDKAKKIDMEKEWQAKNITPLLYYIDPEKQDHALLKETLKFWAEIYRDGILGKEQIVVQLAHTKPSASTVEDNFVDRMLWALSDPSGSPAKRFSEISPTPSLDWLEPITESILQDEDRKNISLVSHKDDFVVPLDQVKKYIVRWLLHYLDEPGLILWIAKYGGKLHPTFFREVEHAIVKQDISESMKTMWKIVFTDRLASGWVYFDLYQWNDLLKLNGLTPLLRIQLREILRPLVKINKSLDIYREVYSDDNSRKYIDWEIELFSGHAKSAIELLSKNKDWLDALPSLLPDFTTLLQDTIEIMAEIGDAEEKYDTTSWHMPSIEKHPQNKGFRDWTLLIELVRDAWLAAVEKNIALAKTEVFRWQSIRYPVFRRLTFFAGTKTDIFSRSQLITWLLEDDHYWLWSSDTKREVIRLLVFLAPNMNIEECKQIEDAILIGVPRKMYREDIEPQEFEMINERSIWIRLAKMHQAGAPLSQKAIEMLNTLSEKYPQWKLAEDERDEFTTWMSSGFDGEKFISVPRECTALKDWLTEEKGDSAFERDNWEEFTSKYVLYSSKVLLELADEEKWNVTRWNTALYAWSRALENKKSIYNYWSKVGEYLLRAPDDILKELVHSLSYWLEAIAKKTSGDKETIFFELVTKIVNIYQGQTLEPSELEGGDQVSRAINHPLGHMMKAVLSWWKHNKLEDGIGLDSSVKDIFTQVCNSRNPIFYYGQLIIATDTIALYRVDTEWTRQHLLPLFDWNQNEEIASGVWKGFMWSPRLYKPLLEEVRSSFLETSKHCEDMEDFSKQYAGLLTFVALDSDNIFTQDELRTAVRSLSLECLEDAVGTLDDLLNSSKQHLEYWKNRVKPYLHDIWPKGSEYLTDEIIYKFMLLTVNSNDLFPQVFETVEQWLQPINDDPHYILYKMKEMELCNKFPESTLKFLCKIVDDNIQWSHQDLKECLEIIGSEEETLRDNSCYKRLLLASVA